MEIKANTSVGEIARMNYRASEIFEKKHIDFCCGGDKTIAEAANEAGMDLDELIAKIESVIKISDLDSNYLNGLSPGELCDYIVKRHHLYIEENAPVILQRLKKLCKVHGDHHPELHEITSLFERSYDDLTIHMKKEELILFPIIKGLARARKSKNKLLLQTQELKEQLNQMKEDHQQEGERFGNISRLTDQYRIPSDVCNTFEVTYMSLQEFDKDLHRHIHTENNILFQKAGVLAEEIVT